MSETTENQDKAPFHKTLELTAVLNFIEGTAYENLRTIDQLLEFGFFCSAQQAYAGQAMAEAKGILSKAKVKAYHRNHASMTSQGRQISPMILKDYVAALCDDEQQYFTLADRTVSACTHTLDLVRTAISALKAELMLGPSNTADRAPGGPRQAAPDHRPYWEEEQKETPAPADGHNDPDDLPF